MESAFLYHKYIPSPLFVDSEKQFSLLCVLCLRCLLPFPLVVVYLIIVCHVSLLLLLSGTCR